MVCFYVMFLFHGGFICEGVTPFLFSCVLIFLIEVMFLFHVDSDPRPSMRLFNFPM